MAHGEVIKDLIKPPFANYDVVVYFGCGLFALPFLMHYLGQHQFHFIRYDFKFEPEFVGTAVTTLVLLFSVYILGHIIAYAGSQFIERTMDSFFGKTSTVVLLSSETPRRKINAAFRAQLRRGLKDSFSENSWLAGLVRLVVHLPVMLPYLGLILFGVFGFYRSRVTKPVVDAARTKFAGLPVGEGGISEESPWFKSLEGYVINNFPTATTRMYNYLVISGLFRSLCMILLSALWFEAGYVLYRACTGHSPPGILMFGNNTFFAQVFSYGAMVVVYLFALFSYLKFQRRYVEEAVFAFVLTKDE